MKKYGFGIIGCGAIARHHADAISKIENAYLAGVTDNIKASCERFVKDFPCKIFDTVEDMLACDEVQIVSICTPSGLHAPIAVKAANAGRHILVEKPMAITKEQLHDMIEAAENNHVKVAVISQLRFCESVQKVKKAIDNGELGKIILGDVYMKYYRSQEYYDSGSWRGTKRIDGGGALMNQGIHGVDLLLYLAGDIKSVHAISKTLVRKIEVEDTLSAIVEYKNGATGVIQATTSVYPGYPRRLDINGENGSIVLDETSIVRWDICNSAGHDDVILMPSFTHGAATPTAISNDGHVLQISDTIKCIREGKAPLSGLADGRRAVDVILAIYQSAEEGKTIYL